MGLVMQQEINHGRGMEGEGCGDRKWGSAMAPDEVGGDDAQGQGVVRWSGRMGRSGGLQWVSGLVVAPWRWGMGLANELRGSAREKRCAPWI